MGMADYSEVRVHFFGVEPMDLDLLCRDLGMSRSKVIRYTVTEKVKAVQREYARMQEMHDRGLVGCSTGPGGLGI